MKVAVHKLACLLIGLALLSCVALDAMKVWSVQCGAVVAREPGVVMLCGGPKDGDGDMPD